jgi:hypothetical protein
MVKEEIFFSIRYNFIAFTTVEVVIAESIQNKF